MCINEKISGTLKCNFGILIHKIFFHYRLLKCGIQELFNISVIDGENCRTFDGKLFKEFDTLLGVFVKAWKQQEEELELKKKEEESLYKIK